MNRLFDTMFTPRVGKVLSQLSGLRIPRYVCEDAVFEILTFCDAFAKSYANYICSKSDLPTFY